MPCPFGLLARHSIPSTVARLPPYQVSNTTTTTTQNVDMSGYRTIPAGSGFRGHSFSSRETWTRRGVSAGHGEPTETLVEIHSPANVAIERTDSSIRLIARHSLPFHQPSPDSRHFFHDSLHQPAGTTTSGSRGYSEGRQSMPLYGLSYSPEPSYGGRQFTRPTAPRQVPWACQMYRDENGSYAHASQQPSPNYPEVPPPIPMRPSSAPPITSLHPPASRQNSRSRTPENMDRSLHSNPGFISRLRERFGPFESPISLPSPWCWVVFCTRGVGFTGGLFGR